MKLKVKGNELSFAGKSTLVQGTVGERIGITFSSEWDSLAVTAVFTAGQDSRDAAVESDEILLPWELLALPGRQLCVNFHGALMDGTVVMRTNVLPLGLIIPSRAPSGHEPDAPSPTRADEIQAMAEQALEIANEVSERIDSGDITARAVLDGSTETLLTGVLCGASGRLGVLTPDPAPVEGGTGLVTSGGVYAAVKNARSCVFTLSGFSFAAIESAIADGVGVFYSRSGSLLPLAGRREVTGAVEYTFAGFSADGNSTVKTVISGSASGARIVSDTAEEIVTAQYVDDAVSEAFGAVETALAGI